nr:hypothetical protein [Tanacetum cinerariifolium]
MSLEASDDLVILDAELVSPTLETGSLPKFNMHLHKSSLTETQVKWLAKCYDIPEDLHPRVAPEGMTMNVLDDKEKKKKKAEEKASTNVPATNIQAEMRRLLGMKMLVRRVLVRKKGQLFETVEKPMGDRVVPKVGASYSTGRFGNLPFTPQWGLMDSSRMDNSHKFRDMMSNLFTPADMEYSTKGFAINLPLNGLGKHIDLIYAYESCKDVKAQYKECKKELAKAQSAYDEKVSAYDQLSKNYDDALTHEKSLVLNTRGPCERFFSLAVGKGFIDEISIGRKEPDIKAILKATPNVDPASSSTFMETYEKLFDKRYTYVDKVARMYLLDLSELQNIMPDETGPTPGGGPHDTPTASYA